jgi:membrane-bound ClpP family serine protease
MHCVSLIRVLKVPHFMSSSVAQDTIPQTTIAQQNLGQSPLDHDADSAKTLIIIAMVVQLIIALLGILSVFLLVGFLWLILDYFLLYKPLTEKRVSDVETPCLVLGIIQIILGGIIPGILLIIAYTKIKDSLRNRPQVLAGPPTQ